MDMIIDASAILAVLLNEKERDKIITLTKGVGLIAPYSLEYEIGNALSALMKRQSLSIADATAVYHGYSQITLRLLQSSIPSAIIVAGEEGIYAYDAYFIVCAEHLGLSLLTLDKKLAEIARKRGIRLAEV